MKALLCLLLLSPAALWAQDKPWRLTTTDFQTRDAALERLTGPALQTDGGLVPVERVLRLDRPNRAAADLRQPEGDPAQPRNVLQLVNGDRYVGRLLRIENDTVHWTTSRFEEIAVPLEQVVGFADVLPLPARSTVDVVQLSNGDRVTGVITGTEGDQLQLNGDNGLVSVPLTSVKSISVADLGGTPARAQGLRMELSDGTILTTPALPSERNEFRVQLPGGGAASVPIDMVVSIESVGGNVRWLDDLRPTDSEYSPYLVVSDDGPGEMPAGDGLRVQGKLPRRSLAMSTRSKMAWSLDGSYRTLRFEYALADNRPLGDVTLIVLLDGTPALTAEHVQSGPGKLARIDVTAVKRLEIVADYGQGLDVQDQLVLVDPVLIRSDE